MKILDVNVYRDGGTKLIETDMGRFWIALNNKIYKGENFPYFLVIPPNPPEASEEEIMLLTHALAYDASKFHWIKRHCT